MGDNIAALLDRHPASPLLRDIGRRAWEEGIPVAVVGGFVRDLLLGILSQDIDIVAEGDAVALSGTLAGSLGGKVARTSAFGTAVLEAGGFKIDLATARTEHYSRPGALPEVSAATLRQDMQRRDFTVNALAIGLSPGDFGRLLDYTAAAGDLAAKRLRVLHPRSFTDDPTRILRGLRLAHRLDFRFEAETWRLLCAAVQDKALKTVSVSRLAKEAALLFEEAGWLNLCSCLDKMGLFAPLFGDRLSPARKDSLGRVDETVAWLTHHGLACRRLPVIALLLAGTGSELAYALLGPGKTGQKLLAALQGVPQVRGILANPATRPHQIFSVLGEFPPAALAYMGIICQNKMEQLRLKEYVEELWRIRPVLSGAEIAGLTGGGPLTGEIRQKLLFARLDGEVVTRKEEIALVKALLAGAS